MAEAAHGRSLCFDGWLPTKIIVGARCVVEEVSKGCASPAEPKQNPSQQGILQALLLRLWSSDLPPPPLPPEAMLRGSFALSRRHQVASASMSLRQPCRLAAGPRRTRSGRPRTSPSPRPRRRWRRRRRPRPPRSPARLRAASPGDLVAALVRPPHFCRMRQE